MGRWRNMPLSGNVQIINGGTPDTSNPKYWDGDIGWLSVEDFNTGTRYVSKAQKNITEQGLQNSSTNLLPFGSIIISARGTVGVVAQIAAILAFNQSCYGINNIKTWTNDFLYYYLSFNKKQILSATQSGVFNTITKDTFSRINVPVPSINEQRRIVAVLSSVDEAIEASRRLAEKYAFVKQGLMRDLLGKGERVVLRKLGGRFFRGNGLTRSDIKKEGVPCIRYGELYTKYDILLANPESHISESLAEKCRHIKHGDVLFTLSGETAEEIGKTVAYVGKEQVAIGGDLAVFTNHKQNPLYLSYILNAPDALKQKELSATGSMVVHITCKRLAEICVPLPSLREQARIAEILTAADERLAAERKHLAKLKNIKRGLMEDLLTNRVSTDCLQRRGNDE